MPFVTETLWRALTDQESLNLATWPTPSGIALDDTAARRVADVESWLPRSGGSGPTRG